MDKKKTTINANKLLEILRGLEQKPDQQETLPAPLVRQAGELKPNQTISLEDRNSIIQKERLFRQVQKEFWDLKSQEKVLFNQNERKIKLQIEALQEELKKLALSTQNLAQEVKVAEEQAPVSPGIYHLNFFEKIRQLVVHLKEQIDESATWLSAFNQRSNKRNYYWAQVRKSGTKFMLSQERYMSTQFG